MLIMMVTFVRALFLSEPRILPLLSRDEEMERGRDTVVSIHRSMMGWKFLNLVAALFSCWKIHYYHHQDWETIMMIIIMRMHGVRGGRKSHKHSSDFFLSYHLSIFSQIFYRTSGDPKPPPALLNVCSQQPQRFSLTFFPYLPYILLLFLRFIIKWMIPGGGSRWF